MTGKKNNYLFYCDCDTYVASTVPIFKFRFRFITKLCKKPDPSK